MILNFIDNLIQELEVDNEKLKKAAMYGTAATVVPHLYANYKYAQIKNKPIEHLNASDAKLAGRMTAAEWSKEHGEPLKAVTKTISAGYKHVYDKFNDYF